MSLGLCRYAVCPLRSQPKDPAEMVSQIIFGEIVEILEKEQQWIRIVAEDGYQGWTDYKFFIPLEASTAEKWKNDRFRNASTSSQVHLKSSKLLLSLPAGAYVSNESLVTPLEIFSFRGIPPPSPNRLELAELYHGAPYLWGGRTPWGIDCSGFTQLLASFENINLPRDAYQQANCGENVLFDNQQAGDFVFFTTSSEKITHVGMLLEPFRIMHAHGCIRTDELQREGIFQSDEQKISHRFHSIRRIEGAPSLLI